MEDNERAEELSPIFTQICCQAHDHRKGVFEVHVLRSSDGRFFVGVEDPSPTEYRSLPEVIRCSEWIEVTGDTESIWCPEISTDELAHLLRIAAYDLPGSPVHQHKFTINNEWFRVEGPKKLIRVA